MIIDTHIKYSSIWKFSFGIVGTGGGLRMNGDGDKYFMCFGKVEIDERDILELQFRMAEIKDLRKLDGK